MTENTGQAEEGRIKMSEKHDKETQGQRKRRWRRRSSMAEQVSTVARGGPHGTSGGDNLKQAAAHGKPTLE